MKRQEICDLAFDIVGLRTRAAEAVGDVETAYETRARNGRKELRGYALGDLRDAIHFLAAVGVDQQERELISAASLTERALAEVRQAVRELASKEQEAQE